jgi:hypothetical protein
MSGGMAPSLTKPPIQFPTTHAFTKLGAGCSNSGLDRSPSQKLAKLVDRQSSIPNDPAHRERVHWIASRDRQNALAIRHDDMLAFPNHSEASFLEGSHSTAM